MAALFKAQVGTSHTASRYRDDITIGVYNQGRNKRDYEWYTKDCECLHYSKKIEESIIMNKLIDIMMEADVEYALENLIFALHRATIELDPMYTHCNRDLIRYVSNASRQRLMMRFRQRLRLSDGGTSRASSPVSSLGSSDEETGGEESD